jgi:hypothetical protein
VSSPEKGIVVAYRITLKVAKVRSVHVAAGRGRRTVGRKLHWWWETPTST